MQNHDRKKIARELYLIHKKIPHPDCFLIMADFVIFYANESSKKEVDKELVWLDQWLELFPEGVKNAGKKIRQDRELCEKKMKRFIIKYGFKPETIIEATRKYLEERALHNFAFTMLSGNLISHPQKGSHLAELCEELLKQNKEIKYQSTGDLV